MRLPHLFLASFPLVLAYSLNTTAPSLSRRRRVADEVSPDYMPPPWLDTRSICHPDHSSGSASSNICDPSGLLSHRHTTSLEDLLAQVHAGRTPYSLVSCDQSSSPNPVGFRLALALVRRMSYDGRTLSDRADNFAHRLFDSWSLSDNCGASVLLFFSLEDKRLFIRTGSLATTYFNEHQIDKVYAKMIPELEKNRVYSALQIGLTEIAQYLSMYNGVRAGAVDTAPPRQGAAAPLFFRSGPSWWDLELSIVFLVFAFMAVLACCNGFGGREATRRNRERRHVLRKLNVIRHEYVAAMLPQYVPTTCPFCHDNLAPAWEPTVPTLPDAEPLESEAPPARPVRKLRCGHAFHESCFDDEHPTPSGTIPDCPVCKDRGGGVSTPPNLNETRGQDYTFRIRSLADAYPHILTEQVVEKLNTETPNLWPESMTEAYLRAERRDTRARDVEFGSDRGGGGGGWFGGFGGLLAAGGLGALIGSMFSGGGAGRQGYYADIPSGGSGNPGGQWFGGSSGNSGGTGFGTGWGGWSGGGDGDGGGGGGGGGGGDYGGGDGGGHGTGW
ncbi:unnamed protein product [Chondrus crispus]|uniref:RING-type domain-containing protein n=1 Tax=Chondrus crispus TaxID=2769 RepID=R7QG77_CHOCR|nr:unnamed protein product [Chondrus crispus]CDF37507.1 unnamed protein product [Chondrus crispus]|eukprot:XP_005717378.1 unnamed protein product [Chondrus crispus]